MQEVFGVRLPQQSDCLTSIDFDLVPNKPPPGVKIFDEEIEEIEESASEEDYEDDEDMDMEPALPSPSQRDISKQEPMREEAPFPISAIATPGDLELLGGAMGGNADDASDGADDDDDLFAGGEDEEESDGMEEVQTNGTMKRKLVEEDDYD